MSTISNPGAIRTGSWDAGFSYNAHDVVLGSDGGLYSALVANAGVEPSTDDGTRWRALAAGTRADGVVGGALGAVMLPRWQAALAMMRNGLYTPRVLCLGDSTTAGFGAAGAAGYTGAKASAYPAKLAAALTARGVAARDTSWMGVNQTQVGVSAYDPRMVPGSGWAVSPYGAIGKVGVQSTTGGSVFSYSPGQACDRVDIYYVNQTTGSFTVNVDGGSTLETVTLSGSVAVAKLTVSFPRGIHTINVVAGTSDFYDLVGMVAYDSTSRAVDVINAGWDAARIANLLETTDPYSSLNAAVTLGPDLYVLNCTINDVQNATDVSTYSTGYAALLDALLAVGDVLVVMPQPVSWSVPANVPAYVKAVYSLCAERKVPVLDISGYQGPYAAAQAAGLIYDTLHPTAAGCGAMAARIAGVLA